MFDSPDNPRSFNPFKDDDLNFISNIEGSESDAQDDDFQELVVAEESDESEDLDPDLVDKDAVNLQDGEKRKNTFADTRIPSRRPYPSPQKQPELKLTHEDQGVMPPIPRNVGPYRPITSISEAMKVGHGGRIPIASIPAGIKINPSNRIPSGPVPVPTHSSFPAPNINSFNRALYESLVAGALPKVLPATATSHNHPSRTPPKPPPRPVSSTIPAQQPTIARSQPPPSRSSTHGTPILGDVPAPPGEEVVKCPACSDLHLPGRCPLRDIEVQQCPGCGSAHLHLSRTCPLLQKPEYIELIYERLKESTEDRDILKAAKTYISGVRADWMLRQAGGRNRKSDKT